jgi:hypothetical protein
MEKITFTGLRRNFPLNVESLIILEIVIIIVLPMKWKPYHVPPVLITALIIVRLRFSIREKHSNRIIISMR